MNEIKLSKMINLDNLYDFKLHAARYNGDVEPLDVFLTNPEDWFYWNTWRNSRDDFSRDYIFSLINFYPEPNTWLFGGIFKVLTRSDVSDSNSYEIEEIEKYNQFVGRLKIHLPKVPRGRAFYLENYYDSMLISEVLKEPYSGEVFPGYQNVSIDFKSLDLIVKTEKKDWKATLENVKGIYVIFDRMNGKKYVGSAYGESGIWSRWKCYVETGHGWNDSLVNLIQEHGLNYAKDNFRVTLLETMSMNSQDSDVIHRENYWKDALLSRGNFGYNSN